MIGVVNYKMGNLRSILNAFEVLGEPVSIIETPAHVQSADAIVIPGVGAFGDGMRNLAQAQLIEPLTEAVLEKKKPFFGVCLGMQLITQRSEEHGEHKGLGWIEATVEKIQPTDPGLRIPHMGWNSLEHIKRSSSLFKDVVEPAVVYFVHSYYLRPLPGAESLVTSTTYHGQAIAATIEKENIWGAQFHPEKSQHTGLTILKNFINTARKIC